MRILKIGIRLDIQMVSYTKFRYLLGVRSFRLCNYMGELSKEKRNIHYDNLPTLGNIWLARNDKIFKHKVISPTGLVDIITSQSFDWCKYRGKGCKSRVDWNITPFLIPFVFFPYVTSLHFMYSLFQT